MTRARSVFLFTTYSYAAHLGFLVADLLPHFLRLPLFRLFLGGLGRGAYIDHGIYFRYPWRIRIGDDVSINRRCEFFPSIRADSGTITLGDHVTISPNVCFYAASHDHGTLELADVAGPIVVGDHAWIAAGSIVLGGITIGAGAVIGAGSVVTRDVPPYTIAVGNPARVIGKREIEGR